MTMIKYFAQAYDAINMCSLVVLHVYASYTYQIFTLLYCEYSNKSKLFRAQQQSKRQC